MEKMTYKADMFLIPNSPIKVEKKDLGKIMRQDLLDKNHQLQEGDLACQIWITSHEFNNWNDGKNPVNGLYLFHHLPIRLFEDKKEGENIEVDLANGDKLNLTLSQTKYRYRTFGSFEETVSNLKERTPSRFL